MELLYYGKYQNISTLDFSKSDMIISYKNHKIRPNVAIDIWVGIVKKVLQYHLFFGGYIPQKEDDLDILSIIVSEVHTHVNKRQYRSK